MFPASNAHACTVPAAAVPAVQREREGTGSLRRRSIAAVNCGGVIGLQPRILFRFSQTKYQLRKKAGCAISASAWIRSRSTDSFGDHRSPKRRGHRQAACIATKPRTCRTRCRQAGIGCRENFSIARRRERSVKTAETRHRTGIAAALMAEAQGTYQTQCRPANRNAGRRPKKGELPDDRRSVI